MQPIVVALLIVLLFALLGFIPITWPHPYAPGGLLVLVVLIVLILAVMGKL